MVYVCLSKKGEAIFTEITKRREAELAPILDELDTEEEKTVLKALTILEKRFKDLA